MFSVVIFFRLDVNGIGYEGGGEYTLSQKNSKSRDASYYHDTPKMKKKLFKFDSTGERLMRTALRRGYVQL